MLVDLCLPSPATVQAQLIAQSIGQAFSVAYQEFLRANGINPEDLSQKEYSDLLNTQDMYNDDLIHFSKSENCKDVGISLSSAGGAGAPGVRGQPCRGGKVGRLREERVIGGTLPGTQARLLLPSREGLSPRWTVLCAGQS